MSDNNTQFLTLILFPAVETIVNDIRNIVKSRFNKDIPDSLIIILAQLIGISVSILYDYFISHADLNSAIAYGVAIGGASNLYHELIKDNSNTSK